MGIIILMIATGLYGMLLGHINYLIRSDMSLGWNVRGVKRTWGETYVGWNVRGWNVRGVKRTWGEMYVGWNVFGVKCHVTLTDASYSHASADHSFSLFLYFLAVRTALYQGR